MLEEPGEHLIDDDDSLVDDDDSTPQALEGEALKELLDRANEGKRRSFPLETAKPAADWLVATLGDEPMEGGLCPAAAAVKRSPELLATDTATLQRLWDALVLPKERGGNGIECSDAEARALVRRYPVTLLHPVQLHFLHLALCDLPRDAGVSDEVREKRLKFLREIVMAAPPAGTCR